MILLEPVMRASEKCVYVPEYIKDILDYIADSSKPAIRVILTDRLE